ncbi:MAG: cyclic nucleotide-binding domain-containing protein, partial [Mangrovicoccus sp.]|nr:cyclic nucleotide-binding domain-containing protein [Mangrovicoccus sp.]
QLVTTTGEVIDTRTIVATIGNAPSAVVRDMDLPFAAGRIAVDRTFAVPGRENVWSLGDCALIPMKEGAAERVNFAPPTAQFAVREARQLAINIAAKIAGKPLSPFEYKSQGALASLGARRGVAEVWGVKLTGFAAWLLWRGYYLAFLPGLATQMRILVNWVLDALSGPSVVDLRSHVPPPVRQLRYRAGDRVFEAGNRADGVYTLLEGAMELRQPDPRTGEEEVRILKPGDHFGERSVLGRRRRSGTVRALEDSRVLVLDQDAFTRVAEGFPAFGDYFRKRLKDRFDIDWNPPRTGGPGPD